MAGCEVRFKFYRGEAVKSRKGAVSGIVQALQINRSGQQMILVLFKIRGEYQEQWFYESNFARSKP